MTWTSERLTALADNPALPAELIDRLTDCGDPDVANTLAGRTDLTRRQVRALAEAAAKNPALPTAAMAGLLPIR